MGGEKEKKEVDVERWKGQAGERRAATQLRQRQRATHPKVPRAVWRLDHAARVPEVALGILRYDGHYGVAQDARLYHIKGAGATLRQRAAKDGEEQGAPNVSCGDHIFSRMMRPAVAVSLATISAPA